MELPEAVRSRLVTLVAASLGDVTPLPAALRQVAGFAPARRAKLGAAAIVSELERDDELRERVALQVRVRANGADVDVAALAWLERAEGWEAEVEEAARRQAERTPQRSADSQLEQRLRARADEAEQALRDQRRAHKETVDALKAEVATLRRTLGETRTKERAARDGGRGGPDPGRGDRRAAGARAAPAPRPAEPARGAGRRPNGGRAAPTRDEVTVRTKLLLETLSEAAAGLRRELALPAVSGSPGDRVEAELAEEGTREPTSTASLDPGSPALLEQYLALPRPRLLVDGYNVTKSTWPTLSLEAQRTRLLTLLAALVARTGVETTVVFDAAESEAGPSSPHRAGSRCCSAPPG